MGISAAATLWAEPPFPLPKGFEAEDRTVLWGDDTGSHAAWAGFELPTVPPTPECQNGRCASPRRLVYGVLGVEPTALRVLRERPAR